MTLEVKLNSYLAKYLPDSGEIKIDFEEALTVEKILANCGIPMEEVSVASFQGKMLDENSLIRQSGRLDLFPAIIGG